MICSFLPIKPKFMWYLKTYLNRHFHSSNPTISGFARFCQDSVSSAQEHGLRQCKPSSIELVYMLGNFAESGTLDHTLIVPIYLPDGTNPVSLMVVLLPLLLFVSVRQSSSIWPGQFP